ncbi:MAG: rhodanese-like domain-containing protein [SAR86 cluster bacterium]|uniref:Rhodanese-like domain-containing protein n=1 Tax=SAR86 cluster bacterium TaxID=2030880 RepID=A0A972W0K9_9GAMM|nr:rhodanese-like domain-containing protein [SAR86 cluster bacterium]
MDQVFEFISNHFLLIGLFVALVFAFVVNEGKRGGDSINTNTLVNLVNRDNALILDVRDSKDFNAGHIVDALNIPFSNFDKRVGELDKFKDRPIIVVCKMGQHASGVGGKLKTLGFEKVHRLGGGMGEWSASSLPIVKG